MRTSKVARLTSITNEHGERVCLRSCSAKALTLILNLNLTLIVTLIGR